MNADIIAKIKNLREKAANAASTEAEALAAFQLADRLMTKHRVTTAQVEAARPDGLKPTLWHTNTKTLPPVRYAASAIAGFTETSTWRSTEDGREVIAYLGMEQDVEMALYLTDLVHNAINHEWTLFAKGAHVVHLTTRERSKARRDFMRAMASRIRVRLVEMNAKKAATAGPSTGSALVLKKRALISKAQVEMGLRLRASPRRTRRVFVVAHDAGDAAGQKTELTTGITA